MSIDRHPAVAGLFYPEEAAALRRQVQTLLTGARRFAGDETRTPKALVAPHAGYVYSGPVAASAYVQIARCAETIHRVVLLGPAHRVAFRGLAFPAADRLLTPLGAVDVDREALGKVSDLPQVRPLDQAFEGEHCLEVQLPFLQTLLTSFRVVPLLVGAAEPAEVAQAIDRLWGGPETLILVSSDLSHYLDYDTAARLDAKTTRAIERLESEALDHRAACGATPLRGLLLEARRRGLSATMVDLRSSGDTAGAHDRVVGYGAYVFR
jgi:MEMO1 family protein